MTFTARAARADDYGLFTRLVVELDIEDPVPTEEQFVARMMRRMLVLCEGDAPVAYALWQAYGPTAHVEHLVVDPAVRGQGAGRALLEAVRSQAIDASCRRWFLNVKQENVSALRLYERCGFTIVHESWTMTTAWSQVDALPAEAVDVELFVPTSEDDPTLAATLALDAARIGLLRARQGEVLLGLRERGVVAAFGAFDPSFPGILSAPGRPRRAAPPPLRRAPQVCQGGTSGGRRRSGRRAQGCARRGRGRRALCAVSNGRRACVTPGFDVIRRSSTVTTGVSTTSRGPSRRAGDARDVTREAREATIDARRATIDPQRATIEAQPTTIAP